eukprot:scaffold172956_cov40-Prasinocladus_malaysianus.AAC.2
MSALGPGGVSAGGSREYRITQVRRGCQRRLPPSCSYDECTGPAVPGAARLAAGSPEHAASVPIVCAFHACCLICCDLHAFISSS